MIQTGPSSRSGRWRFGPGLLVTAAFIGPGTVTTASQAGAKYGYSLLWALVFAVLATIVLQEMAARLGLVARLGVAEAIRQSIKHRWFRNVALGLVLIAIVLGNTAYQTGNLIGAGMGVEALTGLPTSQGAALLGSAIAIVLAFGVRSRRLQSSLVILVLAMSAAFIATALVTQPKIVPIATGLLKFSFPQGSLLTLLALIGTTVVPYNLFLHATAVQQQWSAEEDLSAALRAARIDTVLAISLGGLVTMTILTTAVVAFHQTDQVPAGANELAQQLQPLFGRIGQSLFAVGLTAAGITSAITAPLAAGYVAAGVHGNTRVPVEKVTAVVVVAVGTLLALCFGKSPQATIVTAQAANALLLPLLAVFLLAIMNSRKMLGDYCNHLPMNLAGLAVVVVTCGLGFVSLIRVFSIF